ncbi:Hypothetical predicted protein [Octopus vulgaris]|uniref:Uncharacterized protein n=1 Tax=Octopus vulgaris TaxID=6645 RepID=A0AA36FF43_OCTVU|nr:Hypothetical predicted protein [Octopus vulgaris]
MTERKFRQALQKVGCAAKVRANVSQAVRESVISSRGLTPEILNKLYLPIVTNVLVNGKTIPVIIIKISKMCEALNAADQ